MSALLLDDALLKCVVTEVGLFSIVAFKTLDILQGSVATQLICGGSLVIVLLRIFSWFWEWNNFENRLIFGKVKAYNKLPIYLGHPVYYGVSFYMWFITSFFLSSSSSDVE